MQLNPQQKEAIEYSDGPLMVIAGAGTGKTTVLTEKIKHLIEHGHAKPSEILALTFTEKAAREMQERVDIALPMGYVQTWIATFHSFGEQILRQEALALGLDPGFTLMTQAEAYLFIKKNLYQFDLSYFRPLGNPTKFIAGMATHFSRMKDEDVMPNDYIKWARGESSDVAEEVAKYKELAKAYDTYERLKAENSVMDFSDLISHTLMLFRKKPDILKQYQEQFKYILVDEYQDTNYSQIELAVLLAGGHQRIAVFLDDDQSIYRFRGAAVYNAMDFRYHFPQAKIVVLTQNYRSTQDILDHAYQLVSHNNPDRLEIKEHIDKKLTATRGQGELPRLIWVERGEDEAESVANEIKKVAEHYSWKDIAILVRANNHAEMFTQALARHGVPYQFLGPGQLYNQPEVRDLLAYFRILIDLTDGQAMYRLLIKPYFAIDRRDVAALLVWTKQHNWSVFEALEQLIEQAETTTPPLHISRDSIGKMTELVALLKRHLALVPDTSPGRLLYYFLEDTKLLSLYKQVTTEQQQREVLNISKFFDEIRAFELRQREATVADWMEYVEFVLNAGESPIASEVDWTIIDAVNILTVHSAKGLEFPVVFLVNVVNDRFPTRNRRDQIPIPEQLAKEAAPEGNAHEQEERRLFYVGMTRAKDILYMTGAKFYGDAKRAKKLSGFVHEALGDDVSTYLLKSAPEQSVLPLFQMEDDRKERLASKEERVEPRHIDYLDYSRIEAFEICPLHYKLRYMLNVPTPSNGALSRGSSMHNVMRHFYQWVLLEHGVQSEEKKTRKALLKKQLVVLLDQHWIPIGFDSKKQEQLMRKESERWLQEYVDKVFDFEVMPSQLEMPFQFNVKDIKIGGRIDRIDRHQDGTLEIVDYKTGKPWDDKKLAENLQLAIYGLAATDPGVLNQPVDKLRLSLYFFESAEKKSVEVSPERLEQAKKRILDIREQIQQSDFACSRDHICTQGCEYELFCGS